MKISKFTLVIILLGISFLVFRFGIYPPIPSSLLYLYFGIAIFVIFLFISVNNQSLNEFFAPVKTTILEKDKKPLRLIIFIALPILVSSITYIKTSGETKPPAELRSVHPAPPSQIKFRDNAVSLAGLENPFRKDKANFEKYVEEGANIYFKNCFFCHGDNLDGKGHFAKSINPMPANFVDKGTIAQLQESFVFWRISKGGPGLPNEGTPWNSAMPAWEEILTQDEIWKVIMYIYDASGVEPRTWKVGSTEEHDEHRQITDFRSANHNTQSENGGKTIYSKKCKYCHGSEGKGDGVAAQFLYPKPRDLSKARYKLKSTPGGELPTDQDIFKIISNGIRGASMPAWTTLSENDRHQLVDHVKSLAKRFKISKEKGKPYPEPVKPGNPVPLTSESIETGKTLFKKLDCWKCHGENGHGNGQNALTLKDDWGNPIIPANLLQSWNFKGGSAIKEIYKTITTGLAGTPMPSFIDSATDKERWHIANFVKSIGTETPPKNEAVLKSHFVSGALPQTVDDPVWDIFETNEFSLFGQILVEPKMYTPSNDVVYVKSVFNDNAITFLLEWNDITENAPDSIDPVISNFSDAAAIQFPITIPETTASQKPYFLMGNKTLGVNLWRWDRKDGINELNAYGIDKQKPQEQNEESINGSFVYIDGRYKLIFNRTLTTADNKNDIQFETNRFIPISFFLWNGQNSETGAKTAISTWSNLFLEKKNTGKKILYAIIVGLSLVLLELIVVWRVRTYVRFDFNY